jgi:hypothetical protein
MFVGSTPTHPFRGSSSFLPDSRPYNGLQDHDEFQRVDVAALLAPTTADANKL